MEHLGDILEWFPDKAGQYYFRRRNRGPSAEAARINGHPPAPAAAAAAASTSTPAAAPASTAAVTQAMAALSVNDAFGPPFVLPAADDLAHVRVLDNVAAATAAIARLRAAAPPVVAVDLETSVRRTALVQVHWATATVAETLLFDCGGRTEAAHQLVHDSGLAALLSDATVIKVFHDAREDGLRLATDFDVQLECVFDTQIAFAYLTAKELLPHNESNRAGLNSVLEPYGPRRNELKDWMRKQVHANSNFWLHARPLTDTMKQYAKEDVEPLLVAYRAMIAVLAATAPDWDATMATLIEHSTKAAQHRARRRHNGDILPTAANHADDASETTADTDDWEDESDADMLTTAQESDADQADWALWANAAHSDDDEEAAPMELLAELAAFLPEEVVAHLTDQPDELHEALVDVIMDVGRKVAYKLSRRSHRGADTAAGARHNGANRRRFHTVVLANAPAVTSEMLEATFGVLPPLDARLRTVPWETLHRVSALLNRTRNVPVGLTCRIGRMYETIVEEMIGDVLQRFRNETVSLLIIGNPGSGKTTVLRDVTRHLASSRYGLSVMVVDTSHEIAGSADVPHRCIGEGRRMIVPDGMSQHDAMLQAVANHTPEVIVVDEIVRSPDLCCTAMAHSDGTPN